jgi:flavin-dependent dehydrogenase
VAAKADIVVAGAGPAGALTAILLARRGHSVALLTAVRTRPRLEGLSQRVVDILAAHGLEYAGRAVGPEVPRRAAWNGMAAARNVEFVTARDRFDAALLLDAAANGVQCHKVRRLAVTGPHNRPVVTATDQDRVALRFAPRFFIEARGRRAPLPRTSLVNGPATTALVTRIGGHRPAPQTLVESFADGWAWYAADGDHAFLQIFVDSTDGLPKRTDLAAMFDRLAAALRFIPEHAALGPRTGPVTTRSAEARRATEPISRARIRVGDAAAAVDPLSGHGVFEALGSALAASAAVHTILNDPARANLARRFYENRTRLGFERFARVGRDFYALETRWRGRPFWAARASWPDGAPAHAPMRSAPPRIEMRPVVEDGFVVERRVVVTADQPRGIWQVDAVPLADLLDLMRDATVPDPAQTARRLGVSHRQLKTALDWLRFREMLPAEG